MDPNMVSLEKLRIESEKKPSTRSKVVPSAPLKEPRSIANVTTTLKPKAARTLFAKEDN